METKSNAQRIPIIPLWAGLLIILSTILRYSVTPPGTGGAGIRYLAYWLLLIGSSIGTNVLALYLGYTAKSTSNPINRLSKIAFYLVTATFICGICGATIYKIFNPRDFWIGLLPISYNNFPFASSMMVWYIAGPIIDQQISKLSQDSRHALVFLLTALVLVMPFIFVKPLWGITSANSFIWGGTLYLFGVLFANGELQWFTKYRRTITMIIIGFLLVAITAKLIPIRFSPRAIQGRFYANYLLNMGLVSLASFGLLVKFFSTRQLKLGHHAWENWFSLVTYFISCLPIVTYHLATELHFSNNIGMFKWLTKILIYTVIMVLITAAMTLFIEWLSQLKIFQRLITRFTIQRLEDLKNTPNLVKRILHENWRILTVVATGTVLTFIQIFITKISVVPASWLLFHVIATNSGKQLLLTVIIFVCFFMLMFSLMNRFWPALILTSSITVFIGIAEYLKISLRDEPILPADMSMIFAIDEIAKMISPIIVIAIISAIVLLTVMSIVLQRHGGGMYENHSWKKRIITIILMLVFFSGSFFVNHENTLPYIVFRSFNVQQLFHNQSWSARYNGPVLQFINNLDVKIMDKPTDYSKSKVKSIMTKYDHEAQVINAKRSQTLADQTVVFVLSESFSDPNRVPNMKVSPNPIPYITQLKKETDSGLMISSGYGGGTANMEWQSLTGLSQSLLSPTLPTPYTQLVPQQQIAPAFTDLFDSKIAIHPYSARLYNRKEVFEKFGFQRFYYEGSKYKLSYNQKLGSSPYVSDESAYIETLKMINRKQSGSRFIQLSTMQNHTPYNNYYGSKKFEIAGSAFDQSNQNAVQTYAQGIAYTDKAVEAFIKQIDQLDKPVTVVWYGDHLPGLYNSASLAKHSMKLHETDYFIYNNQTHQLSHTNRLISPYSFSALALQNGDDKVTPYYALITNVANQLPAMTSSPTGAVNNAMNGSNIFVDQAGKEIKYHQLTKQQKTLYHDYQLIQYDITAGNQYSAKWAQQKEVK